MWMAQKERCAFCCFCSSSFFHLIMLRNEGSLRKGAGDAREQGELDYFEAAQKEKAASEGQNFSHTRMCPHQFNKKRPSFSFAVIRDKESTKSHQIAPILLILKRNITSVMSGDTKRKEIEHMELYEVWIELLQ